MRMVVMVLPEGAVAEAAKWTGVSTLVPGAGAQIETFAVTGSAHSGCTVKVCTGDLMNFPVALTPTRVALWVPVGRATRTSIRSLEVCNCFLPSTHSSM